MSPENRIQISLLFLRATVFVVMLAWTLDKFINPAHATGVYQKFYFISGLTPTIMAVIGAAELLILLGFLLGFRKTLTYGAVLLFHAVSTLSSYPQYLAPYDGPNLLFFAAWPMLAACFTLFILRDMDTRLVMRGS